jgi:superfamily II DNA or RNA helicase
MNTTTQDMTQNTESNIDIVNTPIDTSINTYMDVNGYHIRKTYLNDGFTELCTNLTAVINDTSGFNNDPVKFPVYIETDEWIRIPICYGQEHYGNPDLNLMHQGDDINITFKLNLWETQMIPVRSMIEAYNKYGGGILSDRCGRGKTMMGCYLISYFKKKTLIIVHLDILFTQWIERLITAFGEEIRDYIGTIRGKVFDIEGKYIVIAMLKTISEPKRNYPEDAFTSFGHVIYDECHRVPAQISSKCLLLLNFPYKLGLSATFRRNDGLTKIFKWNIGNYVYTNVDESNIDVSVLRYHYDCNDLVYCEVKTMYDGKGGRRINRAGMITQISNYLPRTRMICRKIKELIESYPDINRHFLVLSDRKSLLADMYTQLTEFGIDAGHYVGGMKKEALAISATKQVVLSTYPMAREGLDIKSLNVLILATPVTDVEQACGRILRGVTFDVQPIVMDWLDVFAPFIGNARKRETYYKKVKYNIRNIIIKKDGTMEEKKQSPLNYNKKGYVDETIDENPKIYVSPRLDSKPTADKKIKSKSKKGLDAAIEDDYGIVTTKKIKKRSKKYIDKS